MKKERKQFALIQYKIDTLKDSIVTGQYVCVSAIPAFIILDLLGISIYRNLAFISIMVSIALIVLKISVNKLTHAYEIHADQLIKIDVLKQKKSNLETLQRHTKYRYASQPKHIKTH